MQNKISILYYVKRTKPNSNGQVPIYSRITVDGKRFEMSTNRFIEPSKWSSEANKMRGNTDEARSINSYLDILKGKVYDAQKELIHNNTPVNIDTIKNKVIGVEQRARMLVPIFQEHNDKVETLVGQEFAPGTLERYKTSLKHTIEFIQWKYSVMDIDIKDIDHAFITEYEFFLRSVRKCANNTAVKYIKNFKKIVKLCISNGWLDKDPFVNYKAKIREVEREFLSQEEIQTIYAKEFVTERLNQVKDIFVFACFTGLAYIDVKQLTLSNISLGIDGGKWIFTHRQKTETASRIPLLPIPEELIQKYADNPQCLNENKLLPVLSNQKMNSYLKEIADVCGIQKDLTFHIARHTFATTVTLTNGVPIESVSKMLGHTNIKTTQHYAKILDKKVSDDMLILKEKLQIIKLENLKSGS
ncbi:recombinase [Flavobacterium psychrophilum]|uniref:Probable transposase n=1 Tax=Flavobacterium psychrophilum (strain ATCC 49511 / DSM 21280 / CIP 103535 / JIP02/86) TaxID=402612 RepID=R7RU48_FLAPJ|nr:site-specific integrase [Flavobacterium psychrophilum]AIG30310.1 recombinase [Flavobacterium psychrophilum]AIG32585.1 recombinase [Flavobacterium psychrophilum]AIG34740.1 recombinase [Flavobacterium psychrophilum]AIG37105.1 recombinase [Flavobacterium psychrophilum]AIG39369.1 recombinase [Flavobacterium psychrophilum]